MQGSMNPKRFIFFPKSQSRVQLPLVTKLSFLQFKIRFKKCVRSFHTAFRACSTPFKECRVVFTLKLVLEKNIFRYYLSHSQTLIQINQKQLFPIDCSFFFEACTNIDKVNKKLQQLISARYQIQTFALEIAPPNALY